MELGEKTISHFCPACDQCNKYLTNSTHPRYNELYGP
jgi:hypothetical protein